VNFDWRPGPLAILLGANGSGKTSLLHTLDSVQDLLSGETPIATAFPDRSRTRWDNRREQTIELDVRGNGGLYRYRLVVHHDPKTMGKPSILSERLSFDDRPLTQLEAGELRVFDNEGTTPSAPFRVKTTRSGIGALAADKDDECLFWFKEWIWKLWLLRPDPRTMQSKVEGEEAEWLAQNLENFAPWYLHQLRLKPGSMFKANQALAQIMPGFLELFEKNGHLRARFGDETNSHSFAFGHLSEGQRALVALYVLRYVVAVPGNTLVVDEPDNYVALREIQPWLMELTDLALRKDGPQIWLISHHPEVLNLLARDYGWQFFREGTGPTRVKRFAPAEGLDAAETVARGWEDG
jgi:energy-coupling factor transporter ATP-binding protein EcfA2